MKNALPNALLITNLPIEVRNVDNNLLYQPYYRVQIDNWIISIGPRTLVFSNKRPYIGWKSYKGFVIKTLDMIVDAGIIKQVTRVGLRYVNVINRSLFNDTRIKVQVDDDVLTDEETTLHTTMKDPNGFFIGLHLNNNVMVSVNNEKARCSSLIDIDVFHHQEYNADTFKKFLEGVLEESHTIEKERFFKLLIPELLAALGPEYL